MPIVFQGKDESLYRLSKAQCYTSIGLAAAFWQILEKKERYISKLPSLVNCDSLSGNVHVLLDCAMLLPLSKGR